ncbi:hypothetical protein ACFQ21_02680 [Ohtaekwangia kribbensis]|uniref:DUF4157 domain-containing protein n=1 Tax=Ohtaekwangia kribbensis TaxID=688913 RepID=A0ABW3JYU2_9BACT
MVIKSISTIRLFLLLHFLLTSLHGHSQILKSIGKTFGSIVDTGVKITTAPYQSIVNTSQVVTGQANANTIFEPYKQLGQSAGTAVIDAAELANRPQNFIYQQALSFSSTFGEPGKFVFDVGTFTTQLYSQLGTSSAYTVGNILKNQNPFQILAAPLAGAIRAARERHIGSARPLPQNIKQLLAPHFSSEVLDRVRYTVGSVEITLPQFIGRGQKYMGNEYAVVVDDIIVFNNEPPVNLTFWWAHEITHVEQYKNWGVEVFAYKYMKDLGSSIEAEADNKAYKITSDGNSMGFSALKSVLNSTTIITGNNIVSEIYVAQCFFPNDASPVYYLVTNYGKIVAIDPLNGAWIQVGACTPPKDNIAMWTYWTPNIEYAVTPQGGIFTFDPIFFNNGNFSHYQPRQIGHVVNLQVIKH